LKDLVQIIKSKFIIHAGLVIISSGIVIYYLWKSVSKVRLTKWMEEYIEKIQQMLKEDDSEISLETISHIIHLGNEIAEYFYSFEYYSTENNRLLAFE